MLELILDGLTIFFILLAAGMLLYLVMRGVSRSVERGDSASKKRGEAMREVMVVGDEPLVVEGLRQFLSRWGYAVATAADAAEALHQVEGAPPHVILLDLELPGMNGLQILQRLREIAPEAQVLVLTASLNEAAESLARSMGAVDYLVKPQDLQILKRRLEAAMASLGAKRGWTPSGGERAGEGRQRYRAHPRP